MTIAQSTQNQGIDMNLNSMNNMKQHGTIKQPMDNRPISVFKAGYSTIQPDKTVRFYTLEEGEKLKEGMLARITI